MINRLGYNSRNSNLRIPAKWVDNVQDASNMRPALANSLCSLMMHEAHHSSHDRTCHIGGPSAKISRKISLHIRQIQRLQHDAESPPAIWLVNEATM
jgi:hypothetical protein